MLAFEYPFPHLDAVETECNLIEKSATSLEVSTDEPKYHVGDEISVEVRFDSDAGQFSVPVTVSYGEESRSVMTDSSGYAVVDFTARKGGEEISASYAGDSLQSSASSMPDSVYVSDKSLGDYVLFAMLVLVIYGLFHVYRIYGEAWLKR